MAVTVKLKDNDKVMTLASAPRGRPLVVVAAGEDDHPTVGSVLVVNRGQVTYLTGSVGLLGWDPVSDVGSAQVRLLRKGETVTIEGDETIEGDD